MTPDENESVEQEITRLCREHAGDVVHLVEYDEATLGDDALSALCGERVSELYADVEHVQHDYVFLPDPRGLATCGPCRLEANARKLIAAAEAPSHAPGVIVGKDGAL